MAAALMALVGFLTFAACGSGGPEDGILTRNLAIPNADLDAYWDCAKEAVAAKDQADLLECVENYQDVLAQAPPVVPEWQVLSLSHGPSALPGSGTESDPFVYAGSGEKTASVRMKLRLYDPDHRAAHYTYMPAIYDQGNYQIPMVGPGSSPTWFRCFRKPGTSYSDPLSPTRFEFHDPTMPSWTFTEISAGLWEVTNVQCSFVADYATANAMPIGMLFRFEMQLVDSDLGVIPDTQTSFWVRRNDPSLVPDWEVRGLRLGGPGGSPLPGSGTQSDPFVADQIGMGFPPYPFKAQLTLEGTVNDLNKQVARHTANAATYLEDGTQIEPSRFRCANEGGTIDDEHEPWVTGGPPADLEKASLFDLSDLSYGVFINPGCLGSSLPPGAGTSTVRLEMQLVDHDLEVIPDTQTSFWVKFVAPAEDEDTGTG